VRAETACVALGRHTLPHALPLVVFHCKRPSENGFGCAEAALSDGLNGKERVRCLGAAYPASYAAFAV